ncbi:MAG: hypothetical protein OEY18_08795 [Candidatus Aminicenantes bacterium]|nr:hypothetical protein [Candidatus Aminicenantes bacterium]MDH5384790.1 hypothetical protein [Candidatus Aminicenantes bacterium]MDH5742235.1 hypothetical protein [Candidatus Aminicenantes bacterium]
MKLNSPPVGEFDEEKPAFHPVDSQIVLFLIVIDTHIEDGARPEFIAQEEAGVDAFIVIVVIRDQT